MMCFYIVEILFIRDFFTLLSTHVDIFSFHFQIAWNVQGSRYWQCPRCERACKKHFDAKSGMCIK